MSGAISVTTVASYAAIAGTVLSTVSAIQQGNTAKKNAATESANALAMGDYQKRQAEADAAVQQSEAQLQARQIREAGDRQRSSARASMAASGVTVGTGTAELIDKEINSNAEEDALMSIYQGDTRALQIRQGGRISEINGMNTAAAATVRGKNAQTAGYFNAASSALSGAGKAYSSWGSTSKAGA
jgi:hypothetical protein